MASQKIPIWQNVCGETFTVFHSIANFSCESSPCWSSVHVYNNATAKVLPWIVISHSKRESFTPQFFPTYRNATVIHHFFFSWFCNSSWEFCSDNIYSLICKFQLWVLVMMFNIYILVSVYMKSGMSCWSKSKASLPTI